MATTSVESSALVKRSVAEVGSAWVRRTVARPVHQVRYTAAREGDPHVQVTQGASRRLPRVGRLKAQARGHRQREAQHLRSPVRGGGVSLVGCH
jgi:hypothetical protein